MKAGLLQYGPVYLDVTQNLETVDGLVRNADFDLLVLPELFSTGYNFVSREDLLSVAEDPGDPAAQTISALKSWSSSTGATIVAGYAELADGLIYNSAAVVSNGELVGNYRKVHLFYREKNFFASGDRFSVFETTDRAGNSYRLGVMICFDWYFPEAARSLALQGADVIAHPSNLVRKDCPRSMPIRALENHVYTITSNRIGTEAARACVEFARDDLGISKLVALIEPENIASIRVAEKLGMTCGPLIHIYDTDAFQYEMTL